MRDKNIILIKQRRPFNVVNRNLPGLLKLYSSMDRLPHLASSNLWEDFSYID